MADKILKIAIASALGFLADQRTRSGVTVRKRDGYEGLLTDEQVEAITADDLVLEGVRSTSGTTRTVPSS